MDIFQTLASMASIISIPLAVYFARKNNSTTSEKARLDIIKTLSYKLSDTTYTLSREDINSVYKSKLREHEISHAKFSQEDIVNDLKTNIMSNAFLSNEVKNNILYNLSTIDFQVEKPSFIEYVHYNPITRLFISPIPYILFIANIIICILLLCPYVFRTILYFLKYNQLDTEYIYRILNDIVYYDSFLKISFIILLFLSVICFFRRKYIKNNFKKHIN